MGAIFSFKRTCKDDMNDLREAQNIPKDRILNNQ